MNQILYGPPGTGKTWNMVYHALAIIEGKPVGALESEDRKEVKGRFDELVEYELSNGVLKEIAERAARPCHIPQTEIVK